MDSVSNYYVCHTKTEHSLQTSWLQVYWNCTTIPKVYLFMDSVSNYYVCHTKTEHSLQTSWLQVYWNCTTIPKVYFGFAFWGEANVSFIFTAVIYQIRFVYTHTVQRVTFMGVNFRESSSGLQIVIPIFMATLEHVCMCNGRLRG